MKNIIFLLLSWVLLFGCVTVDVPIPDNVNIPNQEYREKEQRAFDELDKEINN